MNSRNTFILLFFALSGLCNYLKVKEGIMGIESKHANQLIHEASPYLQQHAHNPVDWYPWGDRAFEKAKQENKPVFLSIGYSTCHWCHVMAHESFENEKIAKILNEHFVSIKVDREELPAIDAVYMDFVQRTTGSGGWPLSVFLTPEGKPFYGGTYYPPVDSYGRPGFERILLSIEDAWRNRRQELLTSSNRITALMQENEIADDEIKLSVETLKKTFQGLEAIYDSQYGGFGDEPKFPQPSTLSFLLVNAYRTTNPEALEMVENTLQNMASGGIYDHLGGGFHRYSVDRQWRVPHFEKMLYDQALISRTYIQAYQITKKETYKQIIEEVFDYVLRDMTSSEGGFYSAEDADSEGHEGTFYVWRPKQIDRILNQKEQALLKAYYGVSAVGNFENGSSILYVAIPLDEAARKVGVKPDEAKDILKSAEKKLFQARQKRLRPHRDEKIIAGWNGLMIASLAYGGAVLNEPRYIQAAQRSAVFVLDSLCSDNRLMRYYAEGKAHKHAVLDDYAYLIRGLIELYQADFDPVWLQHAIRLSEQMANLFMDKTNGGFYLTGNDSRNLIVRTRPDYDGAVPSGNSVAAAELIRLSKLTGQKKYFEQAQNALLFFQSDLKNRSTSLTELLYAVDLWLGPRSEIVIAGNIDSDQTQKILGDLRGRFLPRTVVLVRDVETNSDLLDRISQPVTTHEMIDEKVTIYLCEDFVCKKPMVEYDVFKKAIGELH